MSYRVGDRIEAPDYGITGAIVEIRNLGRGDFYRVRTDQGFLVDLDANEIRLEG